MGKTYTLLGDLVGMQNARLRSVCRDLHVRGYTRMDRNEMMLAILAEQERRNAIRDASD